MNISNPDGSINQESNKSNSGGNTLTSGGAGNDTIIGTKVQDIMFGGPGHDII